MKKIVRLKESDLQRIVKRVLKEQDDGISQTTDKRYVRVNSGLTSLPDPTDISPEVVAISLGGNNIRDLDLTGYERFEELFLLTITDNPIETINVQSVIDVVSNLSRLAFSYVPSEVNEEKISGLSNYIDQMDLDIIYNFTPYNEDND